MEIKILGIGGAINDGLPYNSFLIDGGFLVESPPDIINSAFREKTDFQKIHTIYISHFHADHYFGLPFLFLRLFFDKSKNSITLIGPGGIEKKVKEVCNIAFGMNHPMQKWIEKYIDFEEIKKNREICIQSHYKLRPIKMFHFTETYGFILQKENDKFAYIADTYWDNSLHKDLICADTIIIDLNGEKTDETKVHISEDDLVKYILPKTKKCVKFYGTHLRADKISNNTRIQYLKPGDTIKT